MIYKISTNSFSDKMLNEETYIVDGSLYTMIKYLRDSEEETNLFGVIVGFSKKELNDRSGLYTCVYV